MLAPADTPMAEVQGMNLAVAKVFDDPQMKARLQQLGLSIRPMSVASFESLLRDDYRQAASFLSHFKGSFD